MLPTRNILLTATFLSLCGMALAQPAITVTGPAIPALTRGALSWADYDADGLQDLLICGQDSGGQRQTILLHNSGTSLDPDTSQALAAVSLGDAAWADMDADGDPDLVVTGESGPRRSVTLVYRNVGGVLTLVPTPDLPGLGMGRVRWADMDNDGDPDLVLTGFSEALGFQGLIGRNDGLGVFIAVRPPALNTREWTALDVADVNGDALPDLAFSDISPRVDEGVRTLVLRNAGNMNFIAMATPSLAPLHNGSLDFGDMDGDGRPDLLSSGMAAGPQVAVYKNTGTQFLISSNLTGVGYGDAVWADFDADGDMDLVLAGLGAAGAIMEVYRNTGAGLVLMQGPALMPGLVHVRLTFADWNGDGFLDMAVMGEDPADGKPYAYIGTWNNVTQQFKF
ncbi:MAG: VCBS repeat-containing protein [Bacteroidia bacterium]